MNVQINLKKEKKKTKQKYVNIEKKNKTNIDLFKRKGKHFFVCDW